jgi:hypothetical protein
MNAVSEKIRQTVMEAKPRLLQIVPDSVLRKASPEDWSKQEILGHLVDSALNNHQRCVRGALNAARDFPPYNQNQWVAIQGYNEGPWADLVELWTQVNLHLCRIIDRIPEEALDNPCNIGKETPVTLGFVIQDYLRHLNMHLEQLIGPSE